jgi:hypothetical protein
VGAADLELAFECKEKGERSNFMATNPNIRAGELSSDSPSLEPFVDAETAAKFWAIERRQLLAMARTGAIPAYPASLGSRRKQWRFRLSELQAAITKGLKKS